MIAPWLRNHLIDTGRWNGDAINRRAQIRTHTCGQTVITGLDADHCAWPVTCDPHPLTPTGEMLALLGNRHTYAYSLVRHELDYRDRWTITGRPAGTDTHQHVLAAHTCGTPPLPHHDPTPPTAKETTDACPY